MNVSEFNLDEQSGKVYVEYDNGTGVEKDLAHAITGKLNTTTGVVTLDDASRAAVDRSGPTRRIYPTATARADIQAANDELRDLGGGVIELYGGAVYTLDTVGLIIDTGAGVGIRGNGSYLDCRNVADGTSALTLTSRRPTTVVNSSTGLIFSNVDNDSRNYFGKRTSVEGFMMMGPSGASVCDGIDVDMTPIVGGRAPRGVVRNVVTQGFNRAIRHRNKAYLCEFENGGCVGAQWGLSYELGVDQGENTVFKSWTLGNSVQGGVLIDTQPNIDGLSNVNLRFEGCSIDYNTIYQVKFVSGYGQCRFINSYFEWNSTSTEYPFDFGADAIDTMTWVFENPDLVRVNAANSPATFIVGNKHDVRMHRPTPGNVTGAGVQLTTTGGIGGVPTYANVLANVTGTGKFRCTDLSQPQTTQLPATPTISPENNWLSDGSFSGAGIIDPWYNRDGAGAVSQNTTLGHASMNCLQTTLSTAVSTPKSVRILIPRKGNFVAGQAFVRLSAGSGTCQMTITPCLSYSTPTLNTSPTILKSGAQTFGTAATLGTDGWARVSVPTTNVPRIKLPEWANAILVTLDFYAVNNNGGQVYVDDVHVEQW